MAVYDGTTELWFKNKEEFEKSFKTEIGKTVLTNSLGHLSRRDQLIIKEEILL